MSGKAVAARRSARIQGKEPEIVNIGLPKSSRRKIAQAANKIDTAATMNDNDSWVTLKTNFSTASTTSRRKLEAEIAALKRMAELEEELEKKKIEREKKILDKELELQKAIIDEEEFKTCNADALSQNLSDEDDNEVEDIPPGNSVSRNSEKISEKTNENEDLPQFTSPERAEIMKWLQTDEIPSVKPPTEMQQMTDALTKVFQSLESKLVANPKEPQNMKKYLARQTVAKELPVFSGDPVEWPNFISQYRSTTDACEFSHIENIARLQKSLRGKAKEAVQCMMAVPEKLPEVMQCLEENFGRPDVILKMLTDRAERMVAVKDEKPEALMDLANAVRNLTSTAEILHKKEYLSNPHLMEKLTEKLSPAMKREWGLRVVDIDEGKLRLQEFSIWLNKMARAVRAVTTPQVSGEQEDKKENHFKGRDGRRGGVVAAIEEKKSGCAFCGKHGHKISVCREFLKKTTEEKWKWAVSEKLCFSCLESQHRTSNCLNKKKCNKDGCEKIHHPLLHSSFSKSGEDKQEVKLVSHAIEGCADVPLCVLPVTVTGPKGDVETYALLDCGSTMTLVDADIATQIGATGKKKPLKMKWIVSQTNTENESMEVQIKIKGNSSQHLYSLENVKTVSHLSLPLENVNVKKLKSKYKYLRKVPLPNLENVQPKILIGLNNARLIVPLEVVEGSGNLPMAVKTRLGWALYGHGYDFKNRVDDGFICHVFRSSEDEKLHQMVKDTFRIEDLGIKISENNLMSREDKRTKELTEQTTRRVSGGWETGLLWKENDFVLPESKTMALNRLYSMERKMDKNPVFAEKYCAKIEEYLTKGFVRKLTEEEKNKPNPLIWYLPHFAVFNPNKPNKLRLVFDAAAKSRGVSLNDKLLKGLDLLKPLPGVLCKFRQRRIAFGADIKDMFHRVKIREADLPAQRFLWRGMERTDPPDTYVMDVMIFGAVSSPYSAQEVKNRNALTLDPPPSENAVRAILDRHYMDDYLDSCNEEAEARKLILEVVEVHKRGGFQICNWICSHKKILDVLPADLRAPEKIIVNLEGESTEGESATERVLGLHWSPERDIFVFTTKLKKIDTELVNGTKRPTKREALSVVMSVFDPLGFLAHLTIKAKILLQDVWRSEIDWDEKLHDHLLEKWNRWLKELQEIQNFEVPRCYFPEINDNTEISLHIFCDSSEQAFAAVAYLRMKNIDKTETAFVMAKSRVAPLRPESIPRLELQGALMGARMAKVIKEYHEIPIAETHFWTDSKTVLCWLRSDGRRFKPFIAHRVGEILEETDVRNWHWVPTKENVADEATRDGTPANLSPGSRWLKGPDFLCKNEELWPQELTLTQIKQEINVEDLEQKRDIVMNITVAHGVLPDINKFSSWLRLIRSTAWMFRFVYKVRKDTRKTPVSKELTVEELENAELAWLKQVQLESFFEDISVLKHGHPVPRRSRLKRLVPILNNHGLVVLRGRINEAGHPGSPSNQPVILDPKHRYTVLLLQHFHCQAGHHGTERILNQVRQKFWILDARAAMKRTLRNCQTCKIRNALPGEVEMGMLPHFRVNPQPRPFTFTGMDYFGPYEVTVGRRHEKRYGALFTCMTTRAVHLELAGSLSTDSCIMAIRRFISRRGAPLQIWSDNGTNFHGASNELKKALEELNQEKLTAELGIKGIDWKYIPPSAPHMGSWERLVRSVKKALNAVLTTRTPKEEILQTLLAEAEHSVNSHPLTHVSDDPNDLESLTPNHFLLGGPSGVQNAGSFTNKDLFSRKNWRVAQRLADIFWQRWVKEYLPTLTRRTKDCGEKKSVEVGDLVFIADGDLKRNHWPRGIVEKTFPGKDGVVRVAEVRTNHGTFRRPIIKLCVVDVKTEVDVP